MYAITYGKKVVSKAVKATIKYIAKKAKAVRIGNLIIFSNTNAKIIDWFTATDSTQAEIDADLQLIEDFRDAMIE